MLTYTRGLVPIPLAPLKKTNKNETLPHTINKGQAKNSPTSNPKILLQTEYAAPRGSNKDLAKNAPSRSLLFSRLHLFQQFHPSIDLSQEKRYEWTLLSDNSIPLL